MLQDCLRYAPCMVTRKSSPQVSTDADPDLPPAAMSLAELLTVSDEERIRRMYDLTPEQSLAIMRKAGLLNRSGKLKRCYR